MIPSLRQLITTIILLNIVITHITVCSLLSKNIIDDKKKPLIIAWDIHDVIVKRNKFKIISDILFNKKIFKAISKTNGKLLKQLWQIRNKNCTDEIIKVAKNNHNNTLAHLIQNATYNQKKLTKGILPIILGLHNAGYKQVIASNIYWPTQWNAFVNQHPELFSSHKKPIFDLSTSQMCKSTKKPCGHNEIIGKPDQRFFEQLIAKNPNTQIIFIDDKKENIRAAKQCNIDGIIFKNAHHLIDALKKRNITLQETTKK